MDGEQTTRPAAAPPAVQRTSTSDARVAPVAAVQRRTARGGSYAVQQQAVTPDDGDAEGSSHYLGAVQLAYSAPSARAGAVQRRAVQRDAAPTEAPAAGGAQTTTSGGGGAQAEAPRDQTRDPGFRRRVLAAASGSIDRINDLMSYGAFDWAITDSEATQALRILQGIPGPNRLVVCQELARGSALARLLDNLPQAAVTASPGAYLTLAAVAGDPRRMRQFFDAAPRVDASADGVALGIVLGQVPDDLIRQQALASIRGGGGHLAEWIAIAPEPAKTQLQTRFAAARAQATSDAQAREQRQTHEREVDDSARRQMGGTSAADRSFQDRVHRIEDLLSYGVFDWAITDGDARHVMQIFAGCGRAEIETTVHALDGRNQTFMNRFLDNIPSGDRYGVHQRTFMRIVAGRRPENNVPFVREMLSTGFLNSVSGEEASIAFQLIRSMPRDLQDQIRSEQGGELWRRLEGGMDQRQANDRDANTYDNAEERQQLMLAFREGCASWPVAQLRGQIEMLCRMQQDDFVERSLTEAGLDRNPTYAWIYERWGFAHGGQPRNEAVFARWRDNVAGDRSDPGALTRLGAAAGLLGQAVSAGASVGVTGHASTDIDLNQAQTALGGDVGGMVLAERQNERENRVQADVNTDTGQLALQGQSLNIASIARMSDGVSLQTGPVRVAGVDVQMKWPTARDPASRMRIAIQSISAQDIWRTTPQAMINVGSAELGGIVIEAARPPGNSPGDRQQGISMLFQELQETATRLMTLLQGANPDAGQMSAALGQSLGNLHATVTIGNINVQNVTNSQGGFVGGAQVAGVHVSIANRRKGDVLRERLAELERQSREHPLTAEEQAEKQAVEQRIQQLAPLETRERELSAREGDHAGRPSHLPVLGTGAPEDGLNAGERDELARIRSELTVSSAEVRVEDIHVTQVSMGGRSAADLQIHDLRAEVTAAPRTGSGDAQGGSDASVHFSVGAVTASDIRMHGGNRLEATEARIGELQTRISARQATDEERALFTRLSAEVADVHHMIEVRDRVRLEPAAEARLGTADRALYTRAQTELEGWTGRDAGTSIRALSMTGENGGAAISGGADLAGGGVTAQVAHAHMEGVDQGGRHVDSVDVAGARVNAQVNGDLRSGAQPAGPQQGLLSRLASAQFDADRLEMAGYHEEGLSLSATLAREQRTIEQAVELGQATAPQRERLTALPGLLEEARRGETRLTELRTQEAAPGGLTREQQAERDALAARCDPHTRAIRRLEANHVHAETTEHGMSMTMGQAGSGTPGMVMEGFEQGTVGPGGQRTTTRSIDRVSADTMRVDASGEGGLAGLGDTAALAGNGQLSAGVSGTGLRMQGYTQGQAGQAGHQHVDSVSAARFSAGYQRDAGGAGSASLEVDGAEVQGVTRNSGRLASLDQALGVYAAQVSSGRPLSAEQEARRAELQQQRHGYEQLQTRLASARTAGQRRSIQAQITSWERVTEQRITRIQADDVRAEVSGVGNVMDDHWNLDDQHLGVRAHVGHAAVGEVHGTDARGRSRRQLRSATLDNVDVTGTNIGGAGGQGSQLHANIGSVEASGVATDSMSIARARGRGISADVSTTVDGQHRRHTGVSGRARSMSASGVNAGGVGVGHASLSNARFNVANAGEGSQSASLSASGVSASGVHYRGGGSTADVDHVRGTGLSVGMGRGGVSGGLRHAEGSGAAFHSGTTEAGAATFEADGAYFSSRGGRVAGGARHVEATGVHYGGDVVRDVNAEAHPNQSVEPSMQTVGRRTASADTVVADDVSGSAGPNGEFGAHVGNARVTGGQFDEVDAQGRQVRHGQAESLNATQVDVRGDRSGRIDASFGVIRGDGIQFRDTTNPQQRISAVVSYFQVGSPSQISVLHWNGSQITEAQVSALAVGGGSSITIGGHQITARSAVTTGLVSIQNLDPSNITRAGGSVQIRNISSQGELLYDSSSTHFLMRRGTIDRAFMEGTGGSEMMVGATGVRAERLDLSHHDTVRERDPATGQERTALDSQGQPIRRGVEFHGDNAHVEAAYASLREGASFELVQAQVQSAGADHLDMHYTSTDDRQAPTQAGPQAPVDLTALRSASGSIEVSGGAVLPGGAGLPHMRIPFHNGQVNVGEIQLMLRGHGVAIGDIGHATAAILRTVLPPAMVPAVTLLELGATAASRTFPLDVGMLQRRLNRPSDGSATDLHQTDGLEVRAQIDGAQGNIRWRDTYQGNVQGGSVTATGDVGRDMTVRARGLHVDDSQAMGGQLQIGHVAARDGSVRIRDLSSGRTDVALQVEGGVVRNVRYEGGPQSSDSSRADAAFQHQATAATPNAPAAVDGASPPPQARERERARR